MRYFVTGATGYLGSRLVERLRGRGHIAVLARGEKVLPGVDEWVKGDLRDVAGIEAARSADVVYHLGGQAWPAAAAKAPALTHEVNAVATLRLAARAKSDARFVFASTAHVYGPPERLPIDEDHPTRPISVYGASKLAAEWMLRTLGPDGPKTAILRIFNTYGPGQDPALLVGNIGASLRASVPLRLRSPDPVRDWIYVDDVVDALVLAGHHPAAAGTTLNIGSGVGRSIREVAQTALEVAGTGGTVAYAETGVPAGEPPVIVADVRRARSVVGWEPRVPFAEGLRQTLTYAR